MNRPFIDMVIFILAMLVAGALGSILGKRIGVRDVQREAIQRGFAHYNPTNAVFEWKQTK